VFVGKYVSGHVFCEVALVFLFSVKSLVWSSLVWVVHVQVKLLLLRGQGA
jgi:hypothetical protein